METPVCIRRAIPQLRFRSKQVYPIGEELSDRELVNIYGSPDCRVDECPANFYDKCQAVGCDMVTTFKCEDELAIAFGGCIIRCAKPDEY